MTRQVWKYELDLHHIGDEGFTARIVPTGATPLSVIGQGPGVLCVYLLVDPKASPVDRRFYVVGTGHQMADGALAFRFVGTVKDGPFVWHVFIGDEREMGA